ncbi:FAD-dependent oxidoreductase [Pseudomonas ovata]|uniref:FAD-dependent oxidoreductase n=1 Tax=Pseudomonas ovata TaxID=1839709 RepID=UPI000D6A033A|nr:FAD-dependent oxidoreductase [Pseudomonas ovata]
MTALDVAVVGAGPAGAIAARYLAQQGCRVLLIDPAPDVPRIGESLPGAARPLLRDLGLLNHLQHSLSQVCIGNQFAWGGAQLRTHDFMLDPHGAGWHLDRARFDDALRQAALSSGVMWWRERLGAFRRLANGWQLQCAHKSVQARWVIDASGRASVVARRLGAGRARDQALIAVYAWSLCDSRDQRTLIEAVDKGWWYQAQLPGGRCVVALHTCPAEAAVLQGCRSSWLEQLARTQHLRSFCQADQWSLPRACDASGSQLQHGLSDGWLAVGDAALAFDPLSSQGLFNALYTGLRGAQAVHQALQGQPQALAPYRLVLQSIRQAYVRQIDYHYRREQRWPREPFWQARNGRVGQ